MACTVASASLSCRAVGSSISAHRSMITLAHHTTGKAYQHHCFISLRQHSHETHVGQARTHLAIQVLCGVAELILASHPYLLSSSGTYVAICCATVSLRWARDLTAPCLSSTRRVVRAAPGVQPALDRLDTAQRATARRNIPSQAPCHAKRVIADPVSEEASAVCRLRPARHRDRLDMYHAEKVRYPCRPPIYMRAHSRTSLDHQSHAGYDLRTSMALSPCTTGHRGCCQASLAYS